MIKIPKYLIPIILVVVIILVGTYYLLSKNPKNTAIPLPEIFPTPTSSLFSLVNAPSESLRGEISTMSGQILWQSRIATQEAVIVNPQQIQQGEKLETGKDSSLTLDFPNAARVNFLDNTAIDIIQTLPSNIVFSQEKGSAEYLNMGNSVVSIRALSLLVQDGGDIIISIDPLKPIVTLKVKSGTAIVAYNSLSFVSHEFTIESGKTYIFNDSTRKGILR
jgi:hypothetical protein